MLEAGCKIIVTGRNQVKLAEAKAKYPAITAIKSDAANMEDDQPLLAQVKAPGGIDMLFNNAGIVGAPDNLGIANDIHYQKAKKQMDINYVSVIRLNNLLLP
ncbi:MAG: SDR family NAD(P)-dependent oxidoreductase [Ferruginibacter sp.]